MNMGETMMGQEPAPDSGDSVFLVVGPESAERQNDYESQWHRSLMSAWLPFIRELGPTIVLDRPESRLAFHAHQARAAGRNPISIQFLPVHRLYPLAGTRLIAATASDFVSAPAWPVGGDVRRRWSRTLPLVDGLLTPLPATEEAFRDGGFCGRVWVVPQPAAPLVSALPDTTNELMAHQIEFGWNHGVAPEPAWQEEDAGPQGASSMIYFWLRNSYYRRVRPLVPSRIHHWALSAYQGVKRSILRPAVEAHAVPKQVDLTGLDVLLARLDPLGDPLGASECLLAYQRVLGGDVGRALIVEIPRGGAVAVSALAAIAKKLPPARAKLMAVPSGSGAADTVRRCASWGMSIRADRESMEWAESVLCHGVPVMAPGRGMSVPVGSAWPGLPMTAGRVISHLPDDPDKLPCMLVAQARFDELERVIRRTLSVYPGKTAHTVLCDAARQASRLRCQSTTRAILRQALMGGSIQTSIPNLGRAA